MSLLKAFLSSPRGAALAALFLTLLAVLPGQVSLPPIDRDEPRFAQATRQMMASGDYVNIRYLDQPRHLQPAGIYWLQSLSVRALGDETRAMWPHRVPSWLSAIATVFLTWWAGGLLFGREVGRIAGVLMGVCLILNAEARLAKIDATLCATTLAAQVALARAFIARERDEKTSPWWAVLFWAALGFAFLLKGPIVLLVTGGTILALLLVERRARWLLSLRPLWGLPLMLAIAAPWYVAIGQATDGAFYRTALGYSVAGKVAGTHQDHGGPFGYHAAAFNAIFWPGSFFAWLAIPFAWARRATPAVRFCLAWILPAWLVFELSGTKLPHYTLPLLPAVAMLSAAALGEAHGRRWLGRPRLFFAAAIVWLLVALVLLIGLPAVRLELQQDGAFGPLLLGAATFVGACIVLTLAAQGRTRAALVGMVPLALAAWLNIFQFTVPGATRLFMSPRVVAALDTARPCPQAPLALLDYHEPSLVFLYGEGVTLTRTPAEAGAFLAAHRTCGMTLVGKESRDALLADFAARGIATRIVATIPGANFNDRGDAQTLTVYAAAQ